MNKVDLLIQEDTSEHCLIDFVGDLNKATLKDIFLKVKKIKSKKIKFLGIDCKQIRELDFSGALLIVDLIAHFSKQQVSVSLENLDTKYKTLILFARKNFRQKVPYPQENKNFFLKYTQEIGKKSVGYIISFISFLSFLGECVMELARAFMHPSTFRYKATLVHIEKSGAAALPIVTLTSFLVGLVIAYQGAEQLARFGANIFIVDMVSIAVFRELAPLIAAIVVAGRSSSSYTAEIGTMKITEEIDALKVMGFNPNLFLVLPRVIALVISMPLIVFFADIVGVFGGMIVAHNHLGVSYSEFIIRARDVLEIKHILIGLFKAPFFGLLIALIGCFRGFQVTGSTESIGKYTTISVVNGIFWVIACNALISVLLTEVGI